MKKKKLVPQPKKGDPEYDALIRDVSEIAKSLVALGETAAKAYEPIVNDLIDSSCKDHMEIQRTMDYLLDFGGNPAVLQLFKKLCRYYFPLDPAATSDYIGFYLEQWEPEKYKKLIRAQRKAKRK
jgi:hypothetical protein